MPVFKRSDLLNRYSWNVLDVDDPRSTGKFDAVPLRRHEGHEVLAFINHILASSGNWEGLPAVVPVGQRIERMIALAPSDAQSREHVWNWIRASWVNG